FNYTFNSGVVMRLNGLDKSANTILLLIQGAQQRANDIDFTPLIQRLGASGQLIQRAVPSGRFNLDLLKQGTQELLNPVLGPLRRLNGGLQQATNIPETIFQYAVGYLTREGIADPTGHVLTSAQIEHISRFANHIAQQRLDVLIRENLPQVSLAQRAAATQMVLALGSLLVMVGAGIGDLGRAIEAASVRHLSAKERDALIASASLSALANIALGLQMPLTKVLEMLMQRYVATRFGNPVALSPQEQAIAQAVQVDFERQRLAYAEQSLFQINRLPAELPATPNEVVPPLVAVIPHAVDTVEPIPVNLLSSVADPVHGEDDVGARKPRLLTIFPIDRGGVAIILAKSPSLQGSSSTVAFRTSGSVINEVDLQKTGLETSALKALLIENGTLHKVDTAFIYNVGSEDLPNYVLNKFRTLLAGSQRLVDVEQQRYVLNHLEDFVWAIRIPDKMDTLSASQHGDAMLWRKTTLDKLKEVLQLAPEADLDARPEYQWITDKVTQVINDAQVNLARTQLPAKFLDDAVLYATLFPNTRWGGNLEGLTFNERIRHFLNLQRIYLDFTPEQLTLSVERLTVKILLKVATARILDEKIQRGYYETGSLQHLGRLDWVANSSQIAGIKQLLVEQVRTLLGAPAGTEEHWTDILGMLSYETAEAVNELSARAVFKRIQTTIQDKSLSPFEINVILQQTFAELPNASVIKAHPLVREYLNHIDLEMTAHREPREMITYGERARNFLAQTLAQSLTAQKLEHTIGRNYDADLTDARFTQGITGELMALRENVQQQIAENKAKYFAALPERERLLAKLRYFLSVDNAAGLMTVESRLTNGWVNDIHHLPANADSVGILQDLQKLGYKSLATIIDQVVTNPAFGASELEVAGYHEAGGIRGLLDQE
ncbi:MAG: hypothetical protein ORN21_04810, partial [Methylophilaceae bacterium]|nr:hypothetical protein [Methylophilaceae bacterium]